MADDHLIPNTTQVPNAILDLLMPFLNDGESRVLMYLCRRTYGFQRETDSVSRDQFVNGIRSGDRQLDFGAGVSRQGAMNALEVLKGIGVVEQLSGGRGRGNIPVFKLNLKCEMVKWLDLIRQEPDTAREKIVERLDLIRIKSLPYGPFNKKPNIDKAPEEKVEHLDLSEKVKTEPIKGLTVRPTKPSSTKPRKAKDPPENADAFSAPATDEPKLSHRRKMTRKEGIPEWSEDLPWPQPLSLIALYHALKPDDWSAIEIVTDARLKKCREYLAQFPTRQFWENMFHKLHEPSWLRDNLSPQNRTLDWLLQKGHKDGIENCAKVAEGSYAKQHPARASPDRKAQRDAEMQDWAKRQRERREAREGSP